jgi:hypothetical protein
MQDSDVTAERIFNVREGYFFCTTLPQSEIIHYEATIFDEEEGGAFDYSV